MLPLWIICQCNPLLTSLPLSSLQETRLPFKGLSIGHGRRGHLEGAHNYSVG
jgi:hypothetical protein